VPGKASLDTSIQVLNEFASVAARKPLRAPLARPHRLPRPGQDAHHDPPGRGPPHLAAKSPDGLAALQGLLPRLHGASARHADTALEAALALPEKDRPVFAAAIHHRRAALVTGDRVHFGHLFGKTVRGTTIHSPRSPEVTPSNRRHCGRGDGSSKIPH